MGAEANAHLNCLLAALLIERLDERKPAGATKEQVNAKAREFMIRGQQAFREWVNTLSNG